MQQTALQGAGSWVSQLDGQRLDPRTPSRGSHEFQPERAVPAKVHELVFIPVHLTNVCKTHITCQALYWVLAL